MMVILCAIRFSENFFKKLIVSTLRKPQYIRKYIKEDLIKVFSTYLIKNHCIMFLSTLKSSQVSVVNFTYTAILLEGYNK